MGQAIVKIADDPRLSEGFKKTSYPTWVETKPCEGKDCGHKRKVKVGARKVPLKGMTGPKCWDLATEAELHWEAYCSACHALQRAGFYAQEARRWMARYHERRAKQKGKK
jgi:hypothetical protein